MSRAGELRDSFDRGFAAASAPPEPPHSELLCIRVGGEPSAILLSDIASLHADLRIVALPGPARELLGVAAIRAQLVPIYDLGAALGHATGNHTPRWTVLVHGGVAGFAFEHYERHVRIPDRSFAAPLQRGHSRGQFIHDGQPRSVIDLGALLASIEARWRHTGSAQEG